MSDNPHADSALEARRQAIRDAVAEAKAARLERAVDFPSPTADDSGGTGTGTSQAEAHRTSREDALSEFAKSTENQSPITNAPPEGELIKNAPPEGPLIKTEPAIPPVVHGAGVAALKAYGELQGDRPAGLAVKAGASAWESAVTAEPGTRLRTVAAHLGFDMATDRAKSAAGIDKPDPNIDGTLDKVRDKLDALTDRARPNRPESDDEEH